MFVHIQKEINQKTALMYNWLNTWRQLDGAYNGWVVHRFDLKRLKEIHDTPWGQGPIIHGLINLYRRTGDITYYLQAKSSVELQMSRLDYDSGKFNFAGFEDDRFSSLVHNALADCALLDFADLVKSKDEKLFNEILRVVQRNFDKYFFGVLWNEEIKAFKFSEVDYYSPTENRYVANMNSVAIESLIRFYKITDKTYYLEKAIEITNWLKTQIYNKEGDIADGGIGYANTHPNWFINIYTALALRGVCATYTVTKDQELYNIMLRTVEHLLKYSEQNMFCHAIHDGRKDLYPYFIAGAGMILKAIDDVNKTIGTHYDMINYVEKILSYQQPSGGVQSFLKYNTIENHRKGANPNTAVWEEYAPGVPWNAHLFEFITRYVSSDLDKTDKTKTSSKMGLTYYYRESKNYFLVFSLFPPKSCTILFLNKKKNKSYIAFSLLKIYSKIIKKIRK